MHKETIKIMKKMSVDEMAKIITMEMAEKAGKVGTCEDCGAHNAGLFPIGHKSAYVCGTCMDPVKFAKLMIKIGEDLSK